jgi:hypothetical protein
MSSGSDKIVLTNEQHFRGVHVKQDQNSASASNNGPLEDLEHLDELLQQRYPENEP